MPITKINDFTGGLSLIDSSNIEDNQFEVLTNMSYNKDKRVQTRWGITNFWNPIGSKPITSYFFWKNDTTGDRMALCTSGTEMYEYNEGTSDWDSIKTWLTEFETDGVTRTRWSFAVYLNIVYMCNGVDAYASYDGATYTEYAGQPKCRYLRYMADSIYGAWQDTKPSTIYATTAWAVDAQTLNANDLKIWGDELGRINGMLDLWDQLLVFKDKKIYSVSGALTTSTPIDSQNGGYSHRAIRNVENAIMYYSDSWVDRVKPRNWLSWASSLTSESLSDNLRALLDKVAAPQRNANAGYYNTFLNNYYFTFDTGNDSVPDTTLVYSSLVSGWSRYIMPSVYDYGLYIDSDWVETLVAASAAWGQMYTLETWFQDFGSAIETELVTKEWDFWDVGQLDTFELVDLVWLKNEWSEINVEIIVDGEIVSQWIIDDSFIDITMTSVSIGTNTIGSTTIGWWDWLESDISLYEYLIRIPMFATWPNIKIRMYSDTNPNVWTLDHAKIKRDGEPIDFFPISNIS